MKTLYPNGGSLFLFFSEYMVTMSRRSFGFQESPVHDEPATQTPGNEIYPHHQGHNGGQSSIYQIIIGDKIGIEGIKEGD